MYIKSTTFFLFFFFCCYISQSQKIENELLWKITGKNLQKPSYLFGTIHILDKKVFNFPDALYKAIDSCQVFSLEINADSCNAGITAYLTKVMEGASVRKKGKKLSELLDESELEQLQRKIDKSGSIKASDLTLKQAYLLKEKLLYPEKKQDDMPTFMDAFLYKIAKDKGKEIAGLESLNSQIDLLEDFTENQGNAKEFVKNIQEKEKDNSLDLLRNMYIDKDLTKIQNLLQLLPASYEKKLLSGRNKKMIIVIDSIIQLRSLFAAVGAAHLPGTNGLILLLRQYGYTVEPVICNTYTHASKYVFEKKEQSWVDVMDTIAGYRVKMPAKPSDIQVKGGIAVMKTYFDLMNYQGYYTMHVSSLLPIENLRKDSLLNNITSEMMMNADGINLKSKNITNHGVEGREYTFEGKNDIQYKVQLLVKDKDLFMLMSNGKNKSNASIDSFYNSFELITKNKLKWSEMIFPEEYITINMPGDKPKAKIVYDNDSTTRQETYTVADATTGSYYFFVLSKTSKGYNYVDDSMQIESVEKRLIDKVLHFDRKKIATPTYRGDEYEAEESKGIMVRGRLIYRGNRLYHALVMYPDNSNAKAEATTYLESIKMLPIPEAPIKLYVAPDSSFKAYSFAPFTLVEKKKDTTNDIELKANTIIHYNSWDKESLINYGIFKKRLNAYYWNSNDTVVLKKWLEMNKDVNDSISDIKYSSSGKLIMAEAIFTNTRSSQRQKIKVIGQGRTRYILTTLIPSFVLNDKEIAAAYDKFTILETDSESLQSDPNAFFSALHSSDSVTFVNAVAQENEVYFSKFDLPFLIKEFPKTFALDSANYNDASTILLNQLKIYANELSVKDIEGLYNQVPLNRAWQKYSILALFKNVKDSLAAYSKLKSLLLNNPPTSGYSSNLFWSLKDKPLMARTLFPELFKLTKDSINSSFACQMAKYLIDSGYLSKDSVKLQLPILIENSTKIRKNIKDNNHNYYGMIELLANFDTPEALNEIKLYQYVPDNYLRYNAISVLLDKKKDVDKAIIDTLAATDDYRINIYDILKTNNKVELFSKNYLTQRYFAKSHLSTFEEADTYQYVRFIEEKEAIYKKTMHKFYLFEIKFNKEDPDSYLAVVGAYENNSSTYFIKDGNDITGIYDKNPFNKKFINNYFKEYLKQMEEIEQENEINTKKNND